MMDPTVCSDRLAAISTDTWFVLGAYFFAFFPWVLLNNRDYITKKWRTVRHTRGHARYHMAFSIVSMMYVGVYAEAQRRAGDSKELGAALAALFLNLIHFVRTVWGLAQLNAFVAWCKEVMECLRAMKGDDVPIEMRFVGNRLEETLMVNNTVVDNELGGTDVGVKLSWRKVWTGVKRCEFKPSIWLVAEDPGLCTARWTATFLCGMANYWYDSWAGQVLTSFFSNDMYSALNILRNVTCSVEESGKSTIVSIRENHNAMSRGAAYGSNELSRCYLFGEFQSYNFENANLRSSYPARKESHIDNRNRGIAVAGLADTVELAKHLGVENLSAMRRYFDRYRLPTYEIWRKAWDLLLEKCYWAPPDNSSLSRNISLLEQIPFPYQLQMVALWDKSTNWRVLQASAHADIYSALSTHFYEDLNQAEMGSHTANVFEVCRKASSGIIPVTSMVGVSMESVRTFLAEWVMSPPDAVDWKPQIPGEEFEFSVSSRVTQRFPNVERERMIWECQRALQSKLSRTSTASRNFASKSELIMLFILSMPGLSVVGEEVDGNEESGVSGTGSSVSGWRRARGNVDVSVGVWRALSTAEPQDVQVIIRIDAKSGKASLRLRCGATYTRFKWEVWVNTAMGMMKGFDEGHTKKRGSKGETKRLLRKVDLQEPVVELCPLYWNQYDGSVMKTRTVRIWMGWRVFDGRICKFEMEQWMRACNIDLKGIDDYSVEEREVWRAEEVIRQVVNVDGEA